MRIIIRYLVQLRLFLLKNSFILLFSTSKDLFKYKIFIISCVIISLIVQLDYFFYPFNDIFSILSLGIEKLN